MKIFNLTSIGILSLLLLCTACTKDDDPSQQGPSQEDEGYFMMAIIDGVEFSTDNVGVSEDADTADDYFIIGTEATGDWISFSLDGPVTTGAFSPAAGETISLIYMESLVGVWAAESDMGSGVVTITDNTDTFIQGTFTFTGAQPNSTETVHVAAGSFKAQKI